jgi:TolB-like protein
VKVAVLPLRVNAIETHQYLQKGLADMLSSRIGRAEGVSVLRIEDPSKATTDAAAAVAAAKEVGAAYVVYGSFTAFGGGASLDVECAATEPTAAGSIDHREAFVQAGSLGEIIPQLDDISSKIVRFAQSGPSAPAVSSGPSAAAGAVAGAGAGASEAQVRALEKRIETLERIVFSEPKGAVEEETIGDD